MEIKNQTIISGGMQEFSGVEWKGAKGSAKPDRVDHVNGLLSDAEIETKNLNRGQKSLKAREERLENQVAISEDGDTLQISEDANLRLKQKTEAEKLEKSFLEKDSEIGKLQKEEFQKKELRLKKIKEELKETERKRELQEEESKMRLIQEERRELLQKEMSMEKEEVVKTEDSFAGKSDSDLAKMYLRGDITKAEYDSVIDKRESEREAIREKERVLGKEMIKGAIETEEMKRFELELERAFSTNASDRFKPTDRLAAIEAAEGKEVKKEPGEVKFRVNE